MTNALYGPPQAPVDNALYYDDTQGMPRQRPADPLRWLADAVGQNKDLPAPQFFMDPRALSARNMLHSGLNTAANWLDGTKDPRLIGPQEMVSPLGLAGVGGVMNAMTRPGRDFRIADDLARQHPEASAVGEIPKFAPIRDASNPTSAAHVYDYGLMPGTPRAPVNTNATPYAVMADNAKGSAPGTVVNSMAERPKFATLEEARAWDKKRTDEWAESVLGRKRDDSTPEAQAFRERQQAEIARLMELAKPRTKPSGEVLADNAKGSAPGTIINSLDMSEAARMQRAREMGFDTERTWYHGTDREFDAFQPRTGGAYSGGSSVPATWMTSKPGVAEAWAGAGGQPGRVIDAHVAAPNLEVVERAFRSPDWGSMDPILQRAKDAGKDGVLFKRSQDHPDSIGIDPRVWNASDVMAMFNPSNIRSTQAAFDPAKRDSANLLAASPSASAPGLAANSTQQQDDQGVMSILRRYGLAE